MSFLVLLHSSANGPPHAICRSKNLVPNSILGTAAPAAVAYGSRRAVRVPEQTGEFVDCALNGSAFGLVLSCPPRRSMLWEPWAVSYYGDCRAPRRRLCLVGLAAWLYSPCGVELRLADVRAAGAAWWAAVCGAAAAGEPLLQRPRVLVTVRVMERSPATSAVRRNWAAAAVSDTRCANLFKNVVFADFEMIKEPLLKEGG